MSTPPGTGDGDEPNRTESERDGEREGETDDERERTDPEPRSKGGIEPDKRVGRSSTRNDADAVESAFEREASSSEEPTSREPGSSSEQPASREPASSTGESSGAESKSSPGDGETLEDRFAGSAAEWGVNDQAATEDRLDFGTYVAVLSRFLANERTRPPLTVSIEGRWGTGKSSFMTLLRRSLEDDARTSDGSDEDAAAEGTGTTSRPSFTVEFNPWRHEGEDALWAAFMLEFFHQVTGELPLVARWRGHVRMALYRLQWRNGWRDLLRVGLVVPLIALALAFPGIATGLGVPLSEFGLAVGRGASVVALGLWTWQNVANPIETELRAYIDDPDYENRVSFIEQFHDDFAEILDAYVGDEAQVYVFIDDLDRCPPSKAAELVQSINLMISSGDPRVFFVIGMDREKVAAGIAAKHGSLLPYLRAAEDRYSRRALQPDRAGTTESSEGDDGEVERSGPTDEGDDGEREEGRRTDERDDGEREDEGPAAPVTESIETFGLEFADNYLEKFVQIPFLIPKPGAAGIGNLVRELATVDRDDAAEDPDTGGAESGARDESRSTATAPTAEVDVLPSDLIVEIGTTVAPALDYNPRMIKTFVNLFRLRTMLATELGLFEAGRLTPEQLGTFVAIGLQWPRLVPQLRDPTVAADLYEFATGETATVPPAIAHWPPRERARLSHLLAASVDGDRRPEQLTRLPDELFWISPRVDTPTRSTDGTTAVAR